jgi:hypothetical protein
MHLSLERQTGFALRADDIRYLMESKYPRDFRHQEWIFTLAREKDDGSGVDGITSLLPSQGYKYPRSDHTAGYHSQRLNTTSLMRECVVFATPCSKSERDRRFWRRSSNHPSTKSKQRKREVDMSLCNLISQLRNDRELSSHILPSSNRMTTESPPTSYTQKNDK